jgi:hypothetical protein
VASRASVIRQAKLLVATPVEPARSAHADRASMENAD